MKKSSLILASLAGVALSTGAIALALKLKKETEDKNKKKVIILNEDDDLDILDTHENDEKIFYSAQMDPMTRNEQIVKEVARMTQEDDNEPLKSDDELAEVNVAKQLLGKSEPEAEVVDELLSVYNYLSKEDVIQAINTVDHYTKEYENKVVTVAYTLNFNDEYTASSFIEAMGEFGYEAHVGITETIVQVKTIIVITYVKLLQDVLCISNQAARLGGNVQSFEVMA